MSRETVIACTQSPYEHYPYQHHLSQARFLLNDGYTTVAGSRKAPRERCHAVSAYFSRGESTKYATDMDRGNLVYNDAGRNLEVVFHLRVLECNSPTSQTMEGGI